MRTIEIASQALQADLQRLTHISQNLANVQTPGYKRLVSVQRAFLSAIDIEQARVMQESPTPAAGQTQGATDHAQGALRATGNPLDLAIEGDGFFVVDARHGPALTRRVGLRLDAQGQIVNESGLPVQGERGALRVASGTTARVDGRGEVWAGDRTVGRLLVVRVGDRAGLQSVGGGLFSTNEQPVPISVPTLRPGHQEASNVDSSREMVHLMETSRHFEAMARLLQGYDETIEKAIRKLGDL